MGASYKLIEMILSRFNDNANLSDFTTGRTDVWLEFFRAFKEDTFLLLLGRGYTEVVLSTKGSHNTFIQMIFQFGLVGSVIFIGWCGCVLRMYLKGVKMKKSYLTKLLIILIGTLGPWMALDMLFADEIFLVPAYMCVGIAYLSNCETVSPLSNVNERYLRYGNKRKKR